MEMKIEGAVLQIYGVVVLSAILGYLQLLYQGGCGGGGGGGVEREGCFSSHTISLFVTISLASLTAYMPLLSFTFLKIFFFYVIFAWASILTSSVPAKLMWVPYLSLFRPFFHLLPNPFQDRFLRFFQTLWNDAELHMRAAIERLVSPVASAPPLSSSSQEAGGVSVEEVIPGVSVELMNCMIAEFALLKSA